MKNTKKKLTGKIKTVNHSFKGSKITRYAGLNPVGKFLNRQKIYQRFNRVFPTRFHNATKFSNAQILMAIVLASLSGINRMKRIANFTYDPLVQTLLSLSTAINENAISKALKQLGQTGARKLQNFILSYNAQQLKKSGLRSITLDADSTVSIAYGHQEGAEKGYNPIKKGANSYHPLLIFVSELKLLFHTWFRTGSAYTSNGITEFLKEVHAHLPKTVKHVFFRADSGFFSGELFDLLEDYGWTYLVKVKLKGLIPSLKNKPWKPVKGKSNVWICEFSYTTKSWNGKTRKLKAIRTIEKYVEVYFFGRKHYLPIYQYACYISNDESKNALELHELYTRRSTSETWIEEVKTQLKAGKTLTQDFWANDILWQLNSFAYNLSVLMRWRHSLFRRQEHKTFRDWFILVPGKMVRSGRKVEIKMYKNYYYKGNWLELASLLATA